LLTDPASQKSWVTMPRRREKLLKALDRISEAALGPADLTAFLENLLRITLESTESVDTAAVLLKDGDILRVRAAVGLEAASEETFSIAASQGIAGHVAAARQPIFIRDAGADPRVISRAIREKGVRALYGVPLMRDDRLVGVAHIGSLTANEFSSEDKLLFRTMASRATSVVLKAQLLADLKRAEETQRFLAETSKRFAQSLACGPPARTRARDRLARSPQPARRDFDGREPAREKVAGGRRARIREARRDHSAHREHHAAPSRRPAGSGVDPGRPPVDRAGAQQIFEPFRTMEGQSKSGTGLGLYIAKGIVERHGGRIWAESAPAPPRSSSPFRSPSHARNRGSPTPMRLPRWGPRVKARAPIECGRRAALSGPPVRGILPAQ
jgi:putative methionine-R-sulfoxide reductase with GAF domain